MPILKGNTYVVQLAKKAIPSSSSLFIVVAPDLQKGAAIALEEGAKRWQYPNEVELVSIQEMSSHHVVTEAEPSDG